MIRSQGGDPATCTIDCEGGETTPHRAFGFHSGEVESSDLDGVTMMRGWAYAVDPLFGDPNGGAVYCYNSSPTIRNCIFSANYAGNEGGALWIRYASPRIVDCSMIGNSCGSDGGGACIRTSDVTLTRCRFIENVAWRGGGADCRGMDNTCQFSECSFLGNQANYGGALYCYSAGWLTQCEFSGNVAHVRGGGVYTESFNPSYMTSCTFAGNVATFGGAIASRISVTYLDSCTIFNNAASNQGGGIWLWDNSLWMFDSTISENAAPQGAALSCNSQNWEYVVLRNTILAFGRVGEAVHYDDTGYQPFIELTCCDIYGNEGGDWVGYIADQYGIKGNISLPPLFCGEANPTKPYTLHTDSPCAPAFNPDCGLIGAWPVGCEAASGLEGAGERPVGYCLHTSFPNPFQSVTAIRFDLPVAGTVRLSILDPSGRVVRDLSDGTALEPGTHQFLWDGKDDRGRNLGVGVYFSRLSVGPFSQTRRLLLVR